MRMLQNRQVLSAVVALIATVGVASCGRAAAPAANKTAADEVTAAWTNAFDSGQAAQIAALYAEDARSMPPGSGPISGRSAIESYWQQDRGKGDLATRLTPNDSIAQEDLLHVNGTYEVVARNEGASLAKGQYQQLWRRVDGAWRVQHEIWRLDPSLQRNMDTARSLAGVWTTAYNAGDAKGLTALYDDDAVLSMRPGAGAAGKEGIGAFWSADFGGGKPATKLTLTDVYMAGELAHLEGEYEVTDKGEVTKGHYVQLWMQDGAEWRIHRELWWQ